jgi:hypothetical protein
MSPKIEDYALVFNAQEQVMLINGVLPSQQTDSQRPILTPGYGISHYPF